MVVTVFVVVKVGLNDQERVVYICTSVRFSTLKKKLESICFLIVNMYTLRKTKK